MSYDDDNDLKAWAISLRTEHQVSTLANLIHANNNRVLTETVIRFAMALGARGMSTLEHEAARSVAMENLKAAIEEGSQWRR